MIVKFGFNLEKVKLKIKKNELKYNQNNKYMNQTEIQTMT